MDKRGNDRTRKRVMVRYGIDKLDKAGFTRNVSPGGLFVHTNQVYKPGTTLQIEIVARDRTFSFWARVAWAKQVPPQLAHVLECGMGLQLIQPSQEWTEFFGQWSQSKG